MGYHRDTEDRPPLPGAGYMEDFTTPFLIVAGLLVFILLFAIWAAWGMAVALGLSLLADRAMGRR